MHILFQLIIFAGSNPADYVIAVGGGFLPAASGIKGWRLYVVV